MVPLEMRFLGYHLHDLLNKPKLLDSAMPAVWRHRSRAYYLTNLFQKDKSRKEIEAMGQLAPDDPAVQFDIYLMLRTYKKKRPRT